MNLALSWTLKKIAKKSIHGELCSDCRLKKYLGVTYSCSVHLPISAEAKRHGQMKINLPVPIKQILFVATKRYRIHKFSTSNEKRNKAEGSTPPKRKDYAI